MVTLDLIRCQVCGEPLYSTAYMEMLAGELEALCPQHRQRQAASKVPAVGPGRLGSKVEDK